MAKKTNKTNHVLNLLAGSSEMEEENVKAAKAEKKEAAGANVQVIDPQEEGDDIANEVNRLLEEALEESLEESVEAGVQTSAPDELMPEKAESVESAEPEVAAPGLSEPEMAVSKEPEVNAELKAEDAKMAEAEEVKPVVVKEVELEMDAEEEEPDYAFVNVMGKLVKERAKEYMTEFGNCTCSRCVADTTALALIHLPPKYVVVSKNAETPLLNFYRQHYASQITVEITKACTRVAQHPHHDRD